VLSLLVLGSGFAQTRAARKAAKLAKISAQYDKLKSIVTEGNLEFVGNWASPFTGNRISLIGNPNYLRIENDSTEARLPFFGEMRGSGGYGKSGGINFKGQPQGYTIDFNDEKRTVEIRFNIQNSTEFYRVQLKIGASGVADVYVTSSNRSFMWYKGAVAVLEADRS